MSPEVDRLDLGQSESFRDLARSDEILHIDCLAHGFLLVLH
jgi:hypothetical protein